MLRRLYDWVLQWSRTPYSLWALFLLAFAESSFFPIPPDALLIVMAVALPARSFVYALVCSLGSLLGGCLGYLIGWKFMTLVGVKIVAFYGLEDKVALIGDLYRQYDAWAVAIAGFTPIPYKVFTLTAGMFRIDFGVFFVASLFSRSARFFLVAGLIYRFGPSIQGFIERYFNVMALALAILVVVGFLAVKFVF